MPGVRSEPRSNLLSKRSNALSIPSVCNCACPAAAATVAHRVTESGAGAGAGNVRRGGTRPLRRAADSSGFAASAIGLGSDADARSLGPDPDSTPLQSAAPDKAAQ